MREASGYLGALDQAEQQEPPVVCSPLILMYWIKLLRHLLYSLLLLWQWVLRSFSLLPNWPPQPPLSPFAPLKMLEQLRQVLVSNFPSSLPCHCHRRLRWRVLRDRPSKHHHRHRQSYCFSFPEWTTRWQLAWARVLQRTSRVTG